MSIDISDEILSATRMTEAEMRQDEQDIKNLREMGRL